MITCFKRTSFSFKKNVHVYLDYHGFLFLSKFVEPILFFFMNNWNFVFQCTWTITAFISTILLKIIIVFCEPYDLPFAISVTKVFSCFLTLKIQFKKSINVLENTNFHLNKTSIYFYASNSSNILDHKVRLTAVTESYSSVFVLLSIILTIHY